MDNALVCKKIVSVLKPDCKSGRQIYVFYLKAGTCKVNDGSNDI